MMPDACASLFRFGYALVRVDHAVERVRVDPYRLAADLVGPVRLLERQQIRAVAGGKTFASSASMTPLHTDSQRLLGIPARFQIMVCIRQAESGGASTLLDAWKLVARARSREPALFQDIFRVPRAIPFYFGTIVGPTVTRTNEHLFVTHSPVRTNDPIARALEALVAPEDIVRIRPEAGDILLVDNHRMLHGRDAFEVGRGAPREFQRLLTWPIQAGPVWEEAQRHSVEAGAPVQNDAPVPEATQTRLVAVLAMLRGESPGALAASLGIREVELYRWRDQFVASGTLALTDPARDNGG